MDRTAKVSGLVVWSLFAVQVRSEVVPGRWDKVEGLAVGTAIQVTLFESEVLHCRIAGADPAALEVETEDRRVLFLPKSEILLVESAAVVPDGNLNGVLVGAAAGMSIGFLGMAAFNAKATASGPIWDGEAITTYLGPGLLLGGVGAVAGGLIDSAVKRREVLFRVHKRP